MADILLVCTRCKRTDAYARDIDPSIPEKVVRIEGGPCPRCDDGDFGTETWYDADGNEVVPE
jgi:hypothetical protein